MYLGQGKWDDNQVWVELYYGMNKWDFWVQKKSCWCSSDGKGFKPSLQTFLDPSHPQSNRLCTCGEKYHYYTPRSVHQQKVIPRSRCSRAHKEHKGTFNQLKAPFLPLANSKVYESNIRRTLNNSCEPGRTARWKLVLPKKNMNKPEAYWNSVLWLDEPK